MNRLTARNADGSAVFLPQALDSGEAAHRLACLEDFLLYLESRKADLPAELDGLRAQNAVKTYRFRELMTEQMTNQIVLDLLKRFHASP